MGSRIEWHRIYPQSDPSCLRLFFSHNHEPPGCVSDCISDCIHSVSSESPESLPRGYTPPVDVVLQSSDGHFLGAHSRNLEWFNDGFPLSGSTTPSQIVPLTENSFTLGYLLKFTHNQPAPDLSNLDVDKLLALAEAADKYCNSFALAACRQPMQLLAAKSCEDALKILRFKLAHQDFEGIDPISARTIRLPIIHVLEFFGRDLGLEGVRWVHLRQRWQEFTDQYHQKLKTEPKLATPNYGFCSRRVRPLRKVLEVEVPSMERFTALAEALNTEYCDTCCATSCKPYEKWCQGVQKTLQTPPMWSQSMMF
ncbi:hypothetical protein PM082_024641 [Marasmius tenuissimus]|nr:hypothetical protein PM082_024641 [Marasmius tenuissimus]